VRTPLKLNPISYFILLLAAAIALCLAAFYVAFFHSSSIGTPAPSIHFREIYQSEAWDFARGDYRVHLPDEAVIAPVYNRDDFIGITFQAEHGAAFTPGKTETLDITGGFITMDNDTFQELKGETLFLSVDDRISASRLSLSARQLVTLPTVEVIGHQRIFLPGEEQTYTYLEKDGQALYGPETIDPEHRFWMLSFFGLQLFIAMLFAQMLTLDLPTPKPMLHILKTFPLWREFAAALISLLLLYGAYLYLELPPLSRDFNLYSLSTYAGIMIFLVLLAWKHLISRQLFGVNWQNIWRSIIVSLVLVLVITFFSALKFPTGLTVATASQGATLFGLLFACCLAKELFWRGFIQTLLERTTGRWGGLLLTPVLVTGFYCLVIYTRSPEILADPARQLELFFFLPGLSLLLCYVFLKSRNILGSALLHTLLLFLPQAVTF